MTAPRRVTSAELLEARRARRTTDELVAAVSAFGLDVVASDPPAAEDTDARDWSDWCHMFEVQVRSHVGTGRGSLPGDLEALRPFVSVAAGVPAVVEAHGRREAGYSWRTNYWYGTVLLQGPDLVEAVLRLHLSYPLVDVRPVGRRPVYVIEDADDGDGRCVGIAAPWPTALRRARRPPW